MAAQPDGRRTLLTFVGCPHSTIIETAQRDRCEHQVTDLPDTHWSWLVVRRVPFQDGVYAVDGLYERQPVD